MVTVAGDLKDLYDSGLMLIALVAMQWGMLTLGCVLA